jgi:hypothetical protein
MGMRLEEEEEEEEKEEEEKEAVEMVIQSVSCSIAAGRGKERLDQVREVVNGQLVPRTSRVGKQA